MTDSTENSPSHGRTAQDTSRQRTLGEGDTPASAAVPSTHAGSTGFGSGQISPKPAAGQAATPGDTGPASKLPDTPAKH